VGRASDVVERQVSRLRPFREVDVFTDTAYAGNPVAVVLDASGIDDAGLQRFASWTNLSETTFVLPAVDPGADYGVRIFTPSHELPFAGHPTLGTCHAWLEAGGVPRGDGVVIQECTAGLIRIRRGADRLAFAAPPLVRGGPVDEELVAHVADVLRIDRDGIVDSQWVDNGPGWLAVLLADAAAVLTVAPGSVDLDVGVVGAYPDGCDAAFEVRAFFPKDGTTAEDPVTGSLNASLAGWLIASGRVRTPYVASQGAALGRAGRVHISQDPDATIWVGGGTITCVVGQVRL
jgi:PhzF family phenazine biosynthesis protein